MAFDSTHFAYFEWKVQREQSRDFCVRAYQKALLAMTLVDFEDPT